MKIIKKYGSRLVRRIYAVTTVMAAGLAMAMPAQAAMKGSVPEYPVGMTMGTPSGGLPPAGLYILFKPNYAEARSVNSNGDETGVSSTSWAANAQLLWVPGVKILGGTYAAFIRNIGAVSVTLQTPTGMYLHNSAKPDTEIVPLNLSWKLSQHLSFDAELGFYLNDGDYQNRPGAINIGQNESTIEPNFSLSYVSADWILSGHLLFDINQRNKNAGFVNGQRVSYRNGTTADLDYTLFHRTGSWNYGVVGYWLSQITSDSGPAQLNGGRPRQFSTGLGASHRFGEVNMVATYTQDVYARNVGKKHMFLLALSVKI